MTRILITGAAGFLGSRLLARLLDHGELNDNPISEIILADLKVIAPQQESQIKLTVREGDLADPDFVEELVSGQADSIFHLASMLTLQAEQNPSDAFKVNVEALRLLIDKATNCPRVIFASSIAIHGGDLPENVTDNLNPIPETTYGTHKAINELLIADYSRLGRIDGRCLRLPIVVTRPGAPTPAISDKVAEIIREPLNGTDIAVPLAQETPLPLVSAGAVVDAFLILHNLPASDLPLKRALNLPALTVTVAEIASGLKKSGATGTLTYEPDPQVQKIVDGWPRHFSSEKADLLGLKPDPDIASLIKDYLTQRDLDRD